MKVLFLAVLLCGVIFIVSADEAKKAKDPKTESEKTELTDDDDEAEVDLDALEDDDEASMDPSYIRYRYRPYWGGWFGRRYGYGYGSGRYGYGRRYWDEDDTDDLTTQKDEVAEDPMMRRYIIRRIGRKPCRYVVYRPIGYYRRRPMHWRKWKKMHAAADAEAKAKI